MMALSKTLLAAVSASALLLSGAQAQVVGEMGGAPDMPEDEMGNGWGGLRALGIGALATTQPYRGYEEDTLLVIIPAISFERGRVWFQGKQLGLELTNPKSDGPFELSAILDYRFQSYDTAESDVFFGMEDRDGTLEAGAVATYELGSGVRLLGQARFDVQGTHGGYDLTGQVEYGTKLAKYTWLRASFGLLFRSSEMQDYYFGVLPEEDFGLISSGPDFGETSIFVEGVPLVRPAYEVGETLNPFIGLSVRQALSRNLVVGAFATHDFLPEEIKESPIIQEDTDGQTTVGIFLTKPFLN